MRYNFVFVFVFVFVGNQIYEMKAKLTYFLLILYLHFFRFRFSQVLCVGFTFSVFFSVSVSCIGFSGVTVGVMVGDPGDCSSVGVVASRPVGFGVGVFGGVGGVDDDGVDGDGVDDGGFDDRGFDDGGVDGDGDGVDGVVSSLSDLRGLPNIFRNPLFNNSNLQRDGYFSSRFR